MKQIGKHWLNFLCDRNGKQAVRVRLGDEIVTTVRLRLQANSNSTVLTYLYTSTFIYDASSGAFV